MQTLTQYLPNREICPITATPIHTAATALHFTSSSSPHCNRRSAVLLAALAAPHPLCTVTAKSLALLLLRTCTVDDRIKNIQIYRLTVLFVLVPLLYHDEPA
jgi:hypothetical protein